MLTATGAMLAAVVLTFGALTATAAPAPAAAILHPCSTPTAGHVACMVDVVKANRAGAKADSGTADGSGLQPADIASAYGLVGGVSGTVAVVDAFDNPNLEADLAVYRAQWGLPACTTANGCFRKVSQRGSATSLPTGNAQWGLETSLDVDAVSAACPACSILVVEADSSSLTNMGTAENMAVTLGANAVSDSWGLAENSNAASTSNLYFTHSGVALVASTGDGGYTASPQMPASLPNVIAVGGTTLRRSTDSASTASSTNSSQSSDGTSSNVQSANSRIHAKKAKAATLSAKKAAAKKASAKRTAAKKAAPEQLAAAKRFAAKKAAAKRAAEKKVALLKAQKSSHSPVVVTAPVRAPTPTHSSQPVSTPTPVQTPVATPTPTSVPTPTPTATSATPSASTDATDRGWTETAWSSGGSGCSTSVAKPSWQHDAICPNRTYADLAADADPATGLAIYDTYSSGSSSYTGWLQAGGTSLAAPLVAAMIVRSGDAAAYSNAAPIYAHTSLFNDVTAGSNGGCGTARCNAGVGIDGPTGVGTPMSLSSF